MLFVFFRTGLSHGSLWPYWQQKGAGQNKAAIGWLHASEQLLSAVWLSCSGTADGRLTGEVGQQPVCRLGEETKSQSGLAIRKSHHHLDRNCTRDGKNSTGLLEEWWIVGQNDSFIIFIFWNNVLRWIMVTDLISCFLRSSLRPSVGDQ